MAIRRLVHHLSVYILVLSLLLSSAGPAVRAQEGGPVWLPFVGGSSAAPASEILYRVTIAVADPMRWQRLEQMGIVVLERNDSSALVLVDFAQLQVLAKRQYQPRDADELSGLIAANASGRPWLARSVAPLLEQAAAVAQIVTRSGELSAADTLSADQTAVLDGLRASLRALNPEQRAALADSISLDDDGDGLTNTEESWWCTDPLNPDSDGDGSGDGEEVTDAKKWLANETNIAPANGKPFVGWPDDHPGCYDDDFDSIPDRAERWDLGLNMNSETTDGDKFDDGQELFGLTKPGYGSYPRSIDSNFIPNDMPGWVDPPGNSPFVAAYPIIDVTIIPSTIEIALRTEITAGESHSVGESFGYATSETQGTSTGVGKSESHSVNSWQEVGNSIADGVERSTYSSIMESQSQQYSWEHSLGQSSEIEYGAQQEFSVGVSYESTIGVGVSAEVEANLGVDLVGASVGAEVYAEVTAGISANASAGESWAKRDSTTYQSSEGGSVGYELSKEQGESFAVSQIYERSSSRGIGLESSQSTTITREEYEEISVTQEHQIATGQEWSTATAVDTSHAADLSFQFRIRNTGTDNAHHISDILFNIHIGNSENPISVFASQSVGGTCVVLEKDNLFPGGLYPDVEPATQCGIPLTLEQVKAIDTGAPIRVVIADYNLGDDAEFYENAWGKGVIVEIDDDTWDGDENIDSYLIPTWGSETYQDVIRRYFPVSEDIDGNIASVFTPEYTQSHEISEWREHAIGGRSWWNVYLSDYDSGQVIRFRERVAVPETRVLMRFNQDTDADFFSDRAERKYRTDLENPIDHPSSQLVAGYVEISTGQGSSQVQLVLENQGDFSASGVQAMMFAPDESVDVDSDLVGIAGLIPPGGKILLSSQIQRPEPLKWSENTQPAISGHYEKLIDETYRFTVTGALTDTGYVGITGGLKLEWSNSQSYTNTNIGDGYQPPTEFEVGDGIRLGMGSGPVHNGDSFVVNAIAPRDVFSYTVAGESSSKPIIIVSYNDPTGNHKIVTPIKLENIDDDLEQYSGQMISAPSIEMLSNSIFDEAGENTLAVSVTNPDDTTISNGHLIIAYATLSGEIVHSIDNVVDFQSGPNVYTQNWSVSDFEIAYDSTKQYKIVAFATDHHKRPFAVAIDHFVEIGKSISPSISVFPDSEIDLGGVAQGETYKTTLSVVNTGMTDAWVYLNRGTPYALLTKAVLKQIKPGEFSEFTISIDTAKLNVGPFSTVLELRSNDISIPLKTINVVGTISASSVLATWVDEMHPWDEYVYVPGPGAVGDVKEYTSDILPTSSLPLFILDNTGQKVGLGEGMSSTDLIVMRKPGSPGQGERLSAHEDTDNLDNSEVGLKEVSPNLIPFVIEEPTAVNTTQVIVEDPSLTPPYYNDMCGSAWRRLTNNRGYYFYLTLNTNNPATSSNWATWRPNLPQAGRYQVEAYIASHNGSFYWQCPTLYIAGDTSDAKYQITYRGESVTVVRDQWPLVNQWTDLGTFPFDAGTGGQVYLSDLNGETRLTRSVSFSAIQFTLQPPDAPSIDNISNGSNANSFTVSWQPGFGASSYEWQERYNGGGWGAATPTSSLSINPSGRAPGTWCYQVQSKNDAGSSAWTGEKCTSVKPYSAPVLNAIGNPDGDGNYTISWEPITGATGYLLREDDDSGFSSSTTRYSGSDTQASIINQPSGTWYYQVQANNGAGSGDWSGTQSVTVNQTPNPPTALDPANGGGHLGRQVALSWQDGGDPDNFPNASRQFQVSIRNPDTGWNNTPPLQSGTQASILVPSDGTYLWKAEANDGALNSSWTAEQEIHIYSVARQSSGQIGLALPEAITTYARYGVQYGVQAQLAVANTPQMLHIQVPKRIYAEFTLDALVKAAGLAAPTLHVDVGNRGQDSWTTSVSGGLPKTVSSPNLAAALNAYLMTVNVSGGVLVNVPIAVSLDTTGELFLTNADLTAGADSDPQIAAADISFDQTSPMETDKVRVTAQVHNAGLHRASNVVVAFTATSPDSQPFLIGTGFVPSLEPGGTGSASIEWDTIGYAGLTEVAVFLDAAEQLAESDETNNRASKTVSILSRADLAFSSVTLSNDEPVVGESVTVNVNLKNDGQTAASSQKTILYRGNPDNGGAQIEAKTVAAINPGASRTVAFTWTPTMTGWHRLFIRTDKEGQVNEYDESNNDRWLDVYVGVAGPVLLDSGGVTDVGYSEAKGFGYLNGEPTTSCGTNPEQSMRRQGEPGREVRYRFDHLLPGISITWIWCWPSATVWAAKRASGWTATNWQAI